jgi:hypothetical protein
VDVVGGEAMDLRANVLLLGILMLVVGLVIALVVPVVMIDDPADVAVETMELGKMGSEQVNLPGGEYQVWADGSFGDHRDTVAVSDAAGTPVWSGPSVENPETLFGLQKLGVLKLPDGVYNFTSVKATTLYVTEPIDTGGLGTIVLIGLVLIAVGVVLSALGLWSRLIRIRK